MVLTPYARKSLFYSTSKVNDLVKEIIFKWVPFLQCTLLSIEAFYNRCLLTSDISNIMIAYNRIYMLGLGIKTFQTCTHNHCWEQEQQLLKTCWVKVFVVVLNERQLFSGLIAIFSFQCECNTSLKRTDFESALAPPVWKGNNYLPWI